MLSNLKLITTFALLQLSCTWGFCHRTPHNYTVYTTRLQVERLHQVLYCPAPSQPDASGPIGTRQGSLHTSHTPTSSQILISSMIKGLVTMQAPSGRLPLHSAIVRGAGRCRA